MKHPAHPSTAGARARWTEPARAALTRAQILRVGLLSAGRFALSVASVGVALWCIGWVCNASAGSAWDRVAGPAAAWADVATGQGPAEHVVSTGFRNKLMFGLSIVLVLIAGYLLVSRQRTREARAELDFLRRRVEELERTRPRP